MFAGRRQSPTSATRTSRQLIKLIHVTERARERLIRTQSGVINARNLISTLFSNSLSHPRTVKDSSHAIKQTKKLSCSKVDCVLKPSTSLSSLCLRQQREILTVSLLIKFTRKLMRSSLRSDYFDHTLGMVSSSSHRMMSRALLARSTNLFMTYDLCLRRVVVFTLPTFSFSRAFVWLSRDERGRKGHEKHTQTMRVEKMLDKWLGA